MRRNLITLLSILTITLIASTVWYVRAENKSITNQGFTGDWAVATHSEVQPSPTPTSFFAGLDPFAPVRPTEGASSSEADHSNPAFNPTSAQPDVNFTPNLTDLPHQLGITAQPGNPGKTPASVPTSTQPVLPGPTQNKPTGTYSTLTPLPTQTKIAQAPWVGEWTVWFQHPDETFIAGKIKITFNALQLIGIGKIGGVQYELDILGFDEEKAEGYWTTPATSGYFRWKFINANQFGGSHDEYFGFCGTREKSGKPDPCVILPLR